MGFFKKKTTSTVSSYNGEINGSQPSRPHSKAEKSFASLQQNPRNSGLGRPPSSMPLPDIPIPEPPDPALNPAAYLKSIHSVRERSKLVMEKVTSNSLNHFDVNMDMFPKTANYVVSIIKVCAMRPFCRYPRICFSSAPLSGTLKATTNQYHLTGGGSTSTSAAVHE